MAGSHISAQPHGVVAVRFDLSLSFVCFLPSRPGLCCPHPRGARLIDPPFELIRAFLYSFAS